MIAQYVGKRHNNWDERIVALQFAINTARHEATGYTLAYVLHGRELARPHPEDRRPPAPAPSPDVNRKRLEEAFEVVRIHLARASQRQERHYNLRRRDWRPQIGEQVWKRDRPLSSKSGTFNAKLAPRHIGPLEVRRILSPVVVDLRDARGKWHRHIHVQDLKPAPDIDNGHPEPAD
ncbi:uncharacterized protein [Polyergus mexicanus]|uniref:uncharacterized protein n=1 Tax=Polyergus mexicanus TaxID=615972 RepID=UPI0038B66F38